MSPADVSVPVTVRSPLMTDGMPTRCCVRLGATATGVGGGAVTTGISFSLLVLLENMAGLQESRWVSQTIIQPNFIMYMRSCRTTCGPKPSDLRTLVHPHAHAHQNGGQMGVARVDAHAVIDFDHVAIGS